MQTLRRDMQIIFQDPYASLNPRMRVRSIVGEPLRHPRHRHARPSARSASPSCSRRSGLSAEHAERYPHEFSGGQRQRIGIARALALNPKLIICDEPVSALDVSIRAQVINLLEDLQNELGLTYLFIAHDLSVVKHISDRVAVMYLGKIVEIAGSDALYDTPQHPYTEALLSAVPIPDPETERARRRIILEGDVPSPANPPVGLRLPPALPAGAGDLHHGHACAGRVPAATPARSHQVACYFPARFQDGVRSVAREPLVLNGQRRRSRPDEGASRQPPCPRRPRGAQRLVGLAALSLLGARGAGAAHPSRHAAGRARAALAPVDGTRSCRRTSTPSRAEARLAGSEVDEATAREQAIERLLVRREAERLGVQSPRAT